MKFFLGFCWLVLCAATAYASAEQSAGNIIVTQVTSPKLTVFCSKTSATVILDRVDFDNPGVSAGWSSRLPAYTCSVFLTDKGPFTFACSEEVLDRLKPVDCYQDILVGPLAWNGKTTSQETASGSYWVVEGIDNDDLLTSLRKRGLDL